MKKLLLIFTSLLLCCMASNVKAQSTMLYMGDHYNSNLYVYDTLGGPPFTLLSTLPLTSGAGTVDGTYGLSLNPTTQQMFIAYQTTTGGSTARRLGILDTTSGVIADIGMSGSIADIAFMGDQLFSVSGNNGGWVFQRINQTDASMTTLFSLSPASYGNGLWWNTYTGTDLYTGGAASAYFGTIDTVTMTQTALTGAPPTTVSSAAMKNDSVAYISDSQFWGSTLYEYEINTGVITAVGSTAAGHAMAFNQMPLFIIINGPNTFCDNVVSTVLAASESGVYQWFMDGTPIAGATDSTYIPTASGAYTVDVDGKLTNQVIITVLPAPTADFTASPNPVDLGFVPSGDVDFTNSSLGSDNEYLWDFDNGFTTMLTDPTMAFPLVGSYDIELIAIDTVNGCSDTTVVTVTVINSTGLDELTSDFSVYPIPTNETVFVSMNGTSQSYELELRDIHGKMIELKKISTESSTVSFDLSKYESGMYIIKVFNSEEEGYFKVVKQ